MMKEQSIEEKARAYDEAKINGSRLWECGEITRENYEYMFPELKESVNIDYISGIREELLDIENNAENIVGLTESQWVAIRAAHRLLGEYIAKEQKPAWSEEDELTRKTLTTLVEMFYGGYNNLAEKNRLHAWLKSLKERYTWKPSDEQMKQLGWIAKQNKDNMIGKELMTLCNDLKKLRGE